MRQPANLRFVVRYLIVCLAALFGVPAEAQTLYVTNATNISTSQSYSNGFIGASNLVISVPSGTLGIDSGAIVTVSNTLTMGTGTNTASNSITVSGTNSELNIAYLILGSQSSGNSLVITNGAALRTDLTNASGETVVLGSFAVASNNTITVSGVGSGWIQTNTNSVVTIGNAGDNNQLTFDGGSVSSIGGVINIGGPNSSANSNSMLVTGAGTVLTNRSILLGGGNDQSLVISDGAQVVSTAAGSGTINPALALGNRSGANATGHSATVTGVGTTYSMAGGASIGVHGVGSMVVSNGAQVFNSNNVTVGSSASANGSSALVTGSGSVWSNSRSFTVGSGANTNSSIMVRDGAVVHSGNGTEIGSNTNSMSASVTIDGGTWNQNAQVFRAGYLGSQNRLLITNGGVLNLSTNTLLVGQGTSETNGAHSNIATIAGASSSLNQAALPGASGNVVGFWGRDNSLVVSNGATAVMGGTTASNGMNQIGERTNSSGNSLVVTDNGSVWGGRGDLEIGNRGSSNFVSVLNGGLITNGTMRLGVSNSAAGNYLLVDGAGSVFSNRVSVTVGNGTNTGNQVNLTNGGVLHAGGLLNVQTNSTVNAAGSMWVGQGRPSVQTVNVLHTNANSNSVLTVNGLITAEGTVTVGTRGVLGGAGTVQATKTVIASGGTLSPGNSPGTLNITGAIDWLGGGNYNWQIADAAGTAGLSWDLISVSGALDLSALTSVNQFKINLWSLSGVAPDVNGNAGNFDPSQIYTWTIARALGGITNYTGMSQFLVNIGATNGAGGFANPLSDGTFSVLRSGTDLNLVFTPASAPIPEPGTWAAAALLAAGAAFARWRRRKHPES